jgi:ADP-heptose:LPS heptosyltransferase
MIWPSYGHLPIAKHFKYFPQPHLNLENNNQDYIFFFPVARENQHELHKIPISLSRKIVEFAKKHDQKLICPISKDNVFLKNYCNEIDLEIKICSLDEMWQFSKDCKMAISCDSGPRYFPLHFGKPTLLLTGLINEVFLIRWLLNMNTTISINSSVEEIFERLSILSNPLNQSILY